MLRLRESRLAAGYKNQKEFATILNMPANTYNQWETGKRQPDLETLSAIAKLLNVTVDYLLGNDSAPEKEKTPRKKGVRIPVYGRVAAGIPIDAIEDIIDYEEIDEETASRGDYIALQIAGDSMEPKISKGDVVIVRLQPTVENGEIAIVIVNGDEATCKKIKRTSDGIMLISTNPEYEPMFYSNKEIQQLPIRILGKVVELRAKF